MTIESQQVERVIVALTGSFDVLVRDGTNASMVSLDRSSRGLYIPKIYDFALSNLSPNAIALVLASAPIETSQT